MQKNIVMLTKPITVFDTTYTKLVLDQYADPIGDPVAVIAQAKDGSQTVISINTESLAGNPFFPENSFAAEPWESELVDQLADAGYLEYQMQTRADSGTTYDVYTITAQTITITTMEAKTNAK